MKYGWLSLLLLFVSCASLNSAGPAGPDSTPMEDANVILIETSDTAEKSFDRLDGILKEEGFSIKSYVKNDFLIETNFKVYQKKKVWLTSNVVETDSSSIVELSGMVEVPQFQHRKEYGGAKPDIKNRIKKKNGGYNPAWKIMMGVALRYPNGKIWYSRDGS